MDRHSVLIAGVGLFVIASLAALTWFNIMLAANLGECA